MTPYEQRLSEFADGKKLLRLARPLRDRADALCDACGSTQPRTLYALKAEDSNRHYFVGDTCLSELVKRGAILRRYGRSSGPEAYEPEMQRRGQELKETAVQGKDVSQETPESSVSGLFPFVLVVEAPELYRVIVCTLSPQGAAYSWGYAEETRYEESWHGAGEKGMFLEKVRTERPDALHRSVTRAWQQASSNLGALSGHLAGQNGKGNSHRAEDLSVALVDLAPDGLFGPALSLLGNKLKLVGLTEGRGTDSDDGRDRRGNE